MKTKYVILLVVLFSILSSIVTYLFMKPKNITNDVKTDVIITGELATVTTNTNTQVIYDSKYIYITNTLGTSIGDANFTSVINRDLVNYKHQLFLDGTIGYETGGANFGLGFSYIHIKHKFSVTATIDTKNNYGFNVGYGYRLFAK